MAGIEAGGSFDEAPGRAFRPLAGFIDGASRSRRQIAMTAPVTQQKAGWEHPEKIAMTAPVVQQTAGRPGWRRARRLRLRRSPARAWIQPRPRLQNSKLAVLGSPTSSSAGCRQTPSPPTPWRASSLAWMRPERNAFWVSVYWLRTDPPGGTTAGKRPERRDHVLRRQDDRRLKAISASPMKFRTPALTQATAEAGVFSFMPPPDPASPTCLIRPAGPGPAGAARHEIPATDGSS